MLCIAVLAVVVEQTKQQRLHAGLLQLMIPWPVTVLSHYCAHDRESTATHLQQYLECKALVYEPLLLELRQHVLHKLLRHHVTAVTVLCSTHNTAVQRVVQAALAQYRRYSNAGTSTGSTALPATATGTAVGFANTDAHCVAAYRLCTLLPL